MSLPHRKGYATAGDAMRSKAFLAAEGAVIDESCPCGLVHVRQPAPRVTLPAVPRRRDTGPDGRTRKLVLERDRYACVCCGRPVTGQPYSLQHRKRRSQGGGNEAGNLIVLLGLGGDLCHGRVDFRRDPRDEARGYSLRSWQEPAAVPVWVVSADGSGRLVWLSADGRYLTAAPGEVAA